jgi:hypothetical protein
VDGERELQEEIARLDATIMVLERLESSSEQARLDLEGQRARRADLLAALEALRGASGR